MTQWKSLDGLVDPERYNKVLGLLEYQAGHAIVWRDAIDRWFKKMSGIPDDQHRIDHDPNRIIAADMQLDGYKPVEVEPWETASGGKAYVCNQDRRLLSLCSCRSGCRLVQCCRAIFRLSPQRIPLQAATQSANHRHLDRRQHASR